MTAPDPDVLVQGILAHDRRMIARAMTVVESKSGEHRRIADVMLERLLPRTGNSIRLGITGVPGVGKSTFIESLGTHLVETGLRVAVLAVDPTSRRSGGSILGDRTRMEKLSAHSRAFIRPSPAGGTLGGVAARTREMMLICEAAGYDVVLVETVGVGQSETAVSSMVDFFLVLMLAGAGDELQGIKKGVLELADGLVINKADGDNQERVARARQDLENAMHLIMPVSPFWTPPVLTCSSVTDQGTVPVWEMVLAHREQVLASGERDQRRRRQALDWMWALVDEGLTRRFRETPEVARQVPVVSRLVSEEKMTPSAAAQTLLSCL